jgi:hypothetical protein
MQASRTVDPLTDVGVGSGFLRRIASAFVGFTLGATAVTGAANAQRIDLNIDSSLADYLLEVVCSGEKVDEAYLRSSPFVQAQVRHHTSLSPVRNMDALLAGLEVASRCEIPERDVFRFGPIVEDKGRFEATVDFLKIRAPEIERFVVTSLAPYAPEDFDFSGAMALSIIGNPCGGFASEGYFFLAINCLTAGYEEEFSAIKVVSAHEVFHALQHGFFYPGSFELEGVESHDEALELLFRWVMFEGTAELVADSRQIEGSGVLTDFLTGFAESGYQQIPLYIDLISYAGEILTAGDDYSDRLANIYKLGFAGGGRQALYYAGATMASHMDKTYGREALICIFRLPPEQFVRAYQAAALRSASEEAVPLGQTIMMGADRISRKREDGLAFERCVNSATLGRRSAPDAISRRKALRWDDE